jgi:hypothetical protein
MLIVALIAISCFLIFTYFLTVVLGPYLFFFTSDGLATGATFLKNGIYFYLFTVIFFRVPLTPSISEVFLFLITIFLLCLCGAWKYRESFHKVIRKGSSLSLGGLFSNFLLAMPLVSSMLFTAVVAIINIQAALGAPTTTPSEIGTLTSFELFFSVSYASFIEEIGFRISPIGLFVLLRVIIAKVNNRVTLSKWEQVKLFFTSLIIPDKAKKTVGLKTVSESGIRRGIDRGEWIMIFLTALPFGILHFLGGWSPAKISSAAFSGVAFGLLYLVYGAYAPILLHWFFNYYTWVMFNENATNYYPYLLPISALAALMIFVVGTVGWITFTIIGIKKLTRWKRKPSSTQTEFDQTFTTNGNIG